MSNKGNSLLKRFKTQRSQNKYSFGLKGSSKTPTHRRQLTSRSPAHLDHIQKIQLKDRQKYLIKCINHPLKKANFEPKQSLKQAYCQQCSIKLVKQNMRMIRITEESLYLRTMYEAEFEKINQYEQEVKQMLNRYFEAQRQFLRNNFIKAKDPDQKIVKLPFYKVKLIDESQVVSKIKDLFGSVNLKNIQFISKSKILEQEMTKINNSSRNLISYTKISEQFQHYPMKQNFDDSNITSTLSGRLKRLPSKDGPIQKYAVLK